MSPTGRPIEWCLPVLVLGCYVGAMLYQEPCELHITPFRCPMQWRLLGLGLGCRLGAVLDHESCHIHMAPFGRQVQRCLPIVGLGCRLSAVLDQKASDLHMTPSDAPCSGVSPYVVWTAVSAPRSARICVTFTCPSCKARC